MSNLIEELKQTNEFIQLMEGEFYMNFAIKKANSITQRKYKFIHMLELTDLGWVYTNICNVLADKLPIGERICLGYILSKNRSLLITHPDLQKQRDQLQVYNGFKALNDYQETGKTNILLPWDMATSAIILMSALYACTKSQEMVGLTSKSKTIKEFMLEPICDTYTALYKETLSTLPPSKQRSIGTSWDREALKSTIMQDFYGSKTALQSMEEILHNPYEASKRKLVPAHIAHRDWCNVTQTLLEERGEIEVTWTDPVSGMLAGYTCTDQEHAEVVMADGANFKVSKSIKGNPYHLGIAANPVHNSDAVLLWQVYNAAEIAEKYVTIFSTHDAINCTPDNTNQIRQWSAEAIVDIAMSGYMKKIAHNIGVPAPLTGDVGKWIQNFNPHGFLS